MQYACMRYRCYQMGAALIVWTRAPAAARILLLFSPAIHALIIDVIVLRDEMYPY